MGKACPVMQAILFQRGLTYLSLGRMDGGWQYTQV